MGLAGFLAGNGQFCREVGFALAAMCFFNVGTDGCARAKQLFAQSSLDAGRDIQRLAQLDETKSESEGAFPDIRGRLRGEVSPFTLHSSHFSESR